MGSGRRAPWPRRVIGLVHLLLDVVPERRIERHAGPLSIAKSTPGLYPTPIPMASCESKLSRARKSVPEETPRKTRAGPWDGVRADSWITVMPNFSSINVFPMDFCDESPSRTIHHSPIGLSGKTRLRSFRIKVEICFARSSFQEWKHRAVVTLPSATATTIHFPPRVPFLYLSPPFFVSLCHVPLRGAQSFAPFLMRWTVFRRCSARARRAA